MLLGIAVGFQIHFGLFSNKDGACYVFFILLLSETVRGSDKKEDKPSNPSC